MRPAILDVWKSASHAVAAYAAPITAFAGKEARALTDQVRKNSMRVFGAAGLMAQLALLAAGGISGNPFVMLAGLTGLTVSALNAAFGDRVTPISNALGVVSGVSMAAAGFGLGSHGGIVLGEVVAGVSGAGASVALGQRQWRNLAHHRPANAETIDVSLSTSEPAAVVADVHGLSERLAAFSHKLGQALHRPATQANIGFGISDLGLLKAAISSRSPLMFAAVLCFATGSFALQIGKKVIPVAPGGAAQNGAAPPSPVAAAEPGAPAAIDYSTALAGGPG